jgi:hypothetical protein
VIFSPTWHCGRRREYRSSQPRRSNALRIPLKPWLTLALIAVAVFAITVGAHFYRHRFVRSDGDLFRYLPPRDATLFYLNVAALRHAGILRMVAGTKPVEEGGYRDFIGRTGFDYTKDLNAVAGSTQGSETFCLVRGRFDWNKLHAYAQKCTAGICDMPGSRRDRWISFIEIQPDVMGLAISADHLAARFLRTRRSRIEILSQAPVWISLSHSLLGNPASLPLGARLFAISLESANPVVLSIAPNNGPADVPFELTLDAYCSNAAAADTIRNQLELDTKMLQLGLARQHVEANPADLTGLLTAGSFQVIGSRILGNWPIRKQLLNALQ